jgi:uncharacterized protein with HEPN domain
MMRTFTVLASLAALAAVASPAAAEVQVRVNIVGKDAKTIQNDIRRAAELACWQDLQGVRAISPMRQCVAESVDRAMKLVPPSVLAEAGA